MVKKNYDVAFLIIRLSIGILMLLHGINKISNGAGWLVDMVGSKGLPSFFAYGVYIGEIVAPLMIIFGYATRIGALVFAINCLVAYLMVHAGELFKLNEQGGWLIELLGLYFFASLALVFSGGGKYAVSRKHIWD